MNAPTANASRLILRPTPGARVIGWALAAFGLLFAHAGISAGDEIGGVISMAAGGAFFAVTSEVLEVPRFDEFVAACRGRHPGRSIGPASSTTRFGC
jgi:hypothetical protein